MKAAIGIVLRIILALTFFGVVSTGLAQIIGGLPPIIWANREFGKSIVPYGVRRFAVYEKKPQDGLRGTPGANLHAHTLYILRVCLWRTCFSVFAIFRCLGGRSYECNYWRAHNEGIPTEP